MERRAVALERDGFVDEPKTPGHWFADGHGLAAQKSAVVFFASGLNAQFFWDFFRNNFWHRRVPDLGLLPHRITARHLHGLDLTGEIVGQYFVFCDYKLELDRHRRFLAARVALYFKFTGAESAQQSDDLKRRD